MHTCFKEYVLIEDKLEIYTFMTLIEVIKNYRRKPHPNTLLWNGIK